MIVKHGEGRTQYGPGVAIELTGDEVATAIDAWLVAHGVHVSGPRTVTVNGGLCRFGQVYVDPSGFAIAGGEKVDGRGPAPRIEERSAIVDEIGDVVGSRPVLLDADGDVVATGPIMWDEDKPRAVSPCFFTCPACGHEMPALPRGREPLTCPACGDNPYAATRPA